MRTRRGEPWQRDTLAAQLRIVRRLVRSGARSYAEECWHWARGYSVCAHTPLANSTYSWVIPKINF